MSYCRWSAESSVYVYEDACRGGFTCCLCSLSDDSFNCPTRRLMIAHLLEHVTAGDQVPDSALDELRAEDAVTIDGMCADALARMQERSDARFAEFERESRVRYFYIRRSISQKFRRLREELLPREKA